MQRRGRAKASHVDHIVESQHAIGFHHAVNAVGHPVRPICHAHGGCGQDIAVVRLLTGLVRCVCHQDKAKLFDGLHECRHNVLDKAGQQEWFPNMGTRI